MKRDTLNEVHYLEVVKVDLSLVREWLYGGQHKIDRQARTSLERLSLDLDHPNQLYYYKNGRTWLYRGTTLVSEGAFHQLIQFKDKADRMNILRLTDIDSVKTFLDFSHVPHHPEYFPLDDQDK